MLNTKGIDPSIPFPSSSPELGSRTALHSGGIHPAVSPMCWLVTRSTKEVPTVPSRLALLLGPSQPSAAALFGGGHQRPQKRQPPPLQAEPLRAISTIPQHPGRFLDPKYPRLRLRVHPEATTSADAVGSSSQQSAVNTKKTHKSPKQTLSLSLKAEEPLQMSEIHSLDTSPKVCFGRVLFLTASERASKFTMCIYDPSDKLQKTTQKPQRFSMGEKKKS